ncbi:MAG TPA: phosphodiester glycosidase family protein [Firmicutes bacterium]|nr:phosphodiester glycosidase family protein [Bacillota bacterium]
MGVVDGSRRMGRGLGLALIWLLGLVLVSSSAGAAEPIWPARPVEQFAGWQLSESWTTPVAPGVVHLEERFVNGRGERLVVHRLQVNLEEPTVRVRLSLPQGEVLPLETCSARARRESRPGARVVAAVNGDFYTVTPPFAGLPIGYAVREGELVNTGYGGWMALGVWPDGRVDIDTLGMVGEVEFLPPAGTAAADGTTEAAGSADQAEVETVSFAIDQINRPRGAGGGITLFTPTYGPGTLADGNGVDVVIRADELPLRPGVPLTGTVVAVVAGERNTSIPRDGLVLSAAGYSGLQLAKAAPVGTRVKITVHLVGLGSRTSWDGVAQVVGGSPRLVVNGEVSSERHASLPWGNREPRTAAGYVGKTLFLVTWDGRQPAWSVGATMQEQAEYFLALGAEEALNLDGGGSTTFVVREPGAAFAEVVNRPSDGWERSVSNSLQVVSTAPADGVLAQLLVSPQEARVLPGAEVRFEAIPLDGAGERITLPSPVRWRVEPEPAGESGGEMGSIDPAGRFVAGRVDARVVASAVASPAGGGASERVVEGVATVRVVQAISRLELLPASVSLDPGQSVTFTLNAYDAQGRRVFLPASGVEWTVEAPAGVGMFIPAEGRFEAGEASGTARVEARAGGLLATAQISVGQPPWLIEDFEEVSDLYGDGVRVNRVEVGQGRAPTDPVRFGDGSGRLAYDFTGQAGTSGAYLLFRRPPELPGYPRKIGVWVYGDGQGHWLRGQLRDGSGAFFWIDFTRASPGVSWVGWQYVEAEVPAGKPLPLKFEALRLMETKPDRKGRGTVYFDQLRAIYSEAVEDLTGPRVELLAPATGSGTVIPATAAFRVVISDPGEAASGVDWRSLKVLLDGKEIEPGFDPDSGIVTFQVVEPLAPGEHELLIRVLDRAGNPGEAGEGTGIAHWTFRVEG